MESQEFIRRLENVEREIAESKNLRHDRNEHVSKVIDQLRIEHSDTVDRLARIESAVERLVGAMEGTLGFAGIVKTQQDQGVDIRDLQAWQSEAKSFISGAMFVAAIAGGAVATALSWIFSHIK